MSDSILVKMKINTGEDDGAKVALDIANYLRTQGFSPSWGEMRYFPAVSKQIEDDHPTFHDISKQTIVRMVAKSRRVEIHSERPHFPIADITLWTIPALERYLYTVEVVRGRGEYRLPADADSETQNATHHNGNELVYADGG